MISDDDQKVLIGGNYASYSEVTQHSFVTGRSQLMQVMDNDTLFMHADTLYAIEDTATGNKSYFAYHHVVFFKSNMQGRCDSLSYSNTDTLLRMFNDPVLWTDSNQITADTIYLQLANERIDKLFMYDKSFIASQEDAERFNQIKGADMIGLFSDNELKQITVTGSGQTIYYARDDAKKYIGVNRADCTDMVIYIDSNTVKRIIMLTKPEATLYPMNELNTNELLLRGFNWRIADRPKTKYDIFVTEK
ncbi:MAG: hypothetical protein IPO27_12680 [Bacteroidetes bacterium]|nr:hypothetical protein [Bacteroidota bacterium]